MNSTHFCLTAGSVRRVAVRLAKSAALALVVVLAIPAIAATDREVTSRVPPQYPEMAKRLKITGAVRVEAVVNPEGKVTQVKTVSGSRMLSAAAEDAVRQWRFAPGEGNATVQVDLNFAN